MTEPVKPPMFTREFVLLSIVLACASATMALFFQFQAYLVSLGIDPRWHGFLLGCDAITGIVIQPLLSPYLHMRNARKVVAAGILLMAAALASYSLAVTTVSIALVRIMHGGGFVLAVAAMMELFARYIPRSRSGEGIGIVSIVRLVPYAVMPPLVIYLTGRHYGFTSLVMAAAVFMALVLIPVAFIRPETGGDGVSHKSPGLGGLAESLKNVPIVMVFGVNIFFYSSYTMLFYFMRGFGEHKGIDNPGFFFTLAMIVMIVMRAAGSRYFDRMNKARVSAVCLLTLAISHLMFALAHIEWTFLTLSVIIGALWGVVIPLMMALLFDMSEARSRGLNLNLCLVMMQVGFFVGPLVGGLLVARWGYGMLFLFSAILNGAGALLLLGLTRVKRKA